MRKRLHLKVMRVHENLIARTRDRYSMSCHEYCKTSEKRFNVKSSEEPTSKNKIGEVIWVVYLLIADF